MRYVPTSDEVVERLKKQAKRLKRSGSGKHSELLDRVAKQAGYDHWHHVVRCNESAKAVEQMRAIRSECEAIVSAELRGKVSIKVTEDGLACPPLVLFSTGVGDAWLLEPDARLAMCLLWHGKREVIGLSEDPSNLVVEWDGHFELLGDFFHVATQNPKIGDQAIGGYPLDAVRKALDRAQSTLSKMTDVLGQFDAIEIDEAVIEQMVKNGWSRDNVLKLKAEGFRYSPGRDSLLGPVTSHEDLDDIDEDEMFELEPR